MELTIEPKPWSPEHEQWLAIGVELGFCSEPFCLTHDGPTLTPAEATADYYDEDFCLHAVRVFPAEGLA